VKNEGRAKASTIPSSVFWLLALWVVMVLVALVWGVDNAEATLRDAARRRIAADGHNIAVDFSGRDARLIGTVESDAIAQEITGVIDALPGVRDVNSDLVVVPTEIPEVLGANLSVRVIGDTVSVSGLVPNEETEIDLTEAAEAEFGAGQVINSLVVDDDVASSPWLGRIQDVFAHLGGLRSGGFTADDEGVVVEGEVISEAVRTATLDGITLVLDELLPVTGNLTIAVLPPPTFSASGSDESVILRGTMPNQEAIDGVVAAAERLHGNAEIINILQTGEVAGPMWIESIGGLLDVVTRLNPWTIDIAGGSVSITGLGLDQDLVAAVDVLTDEVVAGRLSIVTDVEVDPAAVATQLTNLLEGNATFETNGTELSSDGIALLDSAIAILEANGSTVLIVEVHTDNEGNSELNKDLSQRRAEAVVAYLVAGGIDPGRLSAVGYGEEQPIADNSTEEGRAQNRRIEFVIQEGEG
jgi:OOP family OmpA-OmpF porin